MVFYNNSDTLILGEIAQADPSEISYLSRISHDIRTPVNTILGMTDMALSCAGDAERISSCLRSIHSASTHLSDLLDEILDLAQFHSGNMSLREEIINIHSFLDDIEALIAPVASEKKQHFYINKENIKHYRFIGDTLKLKRCFLNFLDNAVKYTDEGGHISLTASEHISLSGNYSFFEFIFEDDGCGMSPEFISHIFEPFAREDNVRSINGTGLGMQIAHKIIDLMGGNIDIWSEPGVGSRFTLTFNLEIFDDIL